jgi:predicted Zn-dependent protease
VAEAIDVAKRTQNAVAIEPGRYTVVLAPAATGAIVGSLRKSWNAAVADDGGSPWSRPGGGNKIGLQVLDRRISLWTDPADPELGYMPFDDDGYRFHRHMWIEQGVLKELGYDPDYAQKTGHATAQWDAPLQMTGGTATVDELIASTKRGLYIMHAAGGPPVSGRTWLMTGATRNGLFLIEDGKIARAVKNMRYEDSPLFFLNSVEELGQREDGWPAVKVRDFNFISLTDAV